MTSINLFTPRTKSFDAIIDLPSSWNELTKEELFVICQKLIEIEATGYAGKAEIFLFMLRHNASAQKKKLIKGWEEKLSPDDVAINGLDTINWIFETADLTKQMLPQIPVRHAMLLGPQSNFDDITCGEFEDTEVFFNLYNQSKEHKQIAMITAILWRPDRGRRVSYFEYDAEKMIAAVLNLPQEILMINYLWYIGCRQTLPKLFPSVFSSSSHGTADLSAFTKCIHAGAGPKNGTREQIRKTLLKEFFLDMELEAQNIKNESK